MSKGKKEPDAGAPRTGKGPVDTPKKGDPRKAQPKGPKHGHGRGSAGGV